ncbi:unnamed protein product [Arctia plantaginis]|uniref:Uncharacterized protein n=1 Tax=Arctia plantaginis TaxID=874455 RepID=A0A8S0Z7E5_ARCPL|nr:unnamed protein product [Arctia plantaginis]
MRVEGKPTPSTRGHTQGGMRQWQWWQAGLSSRLATECRYFPKQPERPSDHGGSASGFAPLAHVLGRQPLADKLRRALPPPNPTGVFRPRRKPPRWTPCGIRVWL